MGELVAKHQVMEARKLKPHTYTSRSVYERETQSGVALATGYVGDREHGFGDDDTLKEVGPTVDRGLALQARLQGS